MGKLFLPKHQHVLTGVVAAVITGIGSWIPSAWADEAATGHIATYPFWDQLRLFKHLDLVHSAYYLVMHPWLALLGVNPFTLRLPSVLAVGIAAIAISSIGFKIFGSRSGAALSAACFVLMPRMLAMGIEARSYAMSAMMVALFLWFLIVDQKPRRRWLGLALSGLAAIFLHLYALFPVAVLALVAAIKEKGMRRRQIISVSVISAVICLPFVLGSLSQSKQLSWLPQQAFTDLFDQGFIQSWFTSRWYYPPTEVVPDGIAVGMAIIVALVLVFAVATTGWKWVTDSVYLWVPVAGTVVILWAVSMFIHPTLLGRYLTPAAPFVALTVSAALQALRTRGGRWKLALVLLGAGAVSLGVVQRMPYSKAEHQDYKFIAATVQNAPSGDGIVYESGNGWGDSARNAISCYPDAFKELTDLASPAPIPLTDAYLGDVPVVTLADLPALPARVWVVTRSINHDGEYEKQLESLGYLISETHTGPGHTVLLYES